MARCIREVFSNIHLTVHSLPPICNNKEKNGLICVQSLHLDGNSPSAHKYPVNECSTMQSHDLCMKSAKKWPTGQKGLGQGRKGNSPHQLELQYAVALPMKPWRNRNKRKQLPPWSAVIASTAAHFECCARFRCSLACTKQLSMVACCETTLSPLVNQSPRSDSQKSMLEELAR